MEKNNKEFNELENKLWDANFNIFTGKFYIGMGGLIGAFLSIPLIQQLATSSKDSWKGAVIAGVFFGIYSAVGLPMYLYGKHQQKKIKKEYFKENTLFPDYFLEYKS